MEWHADGTAGEATVLLALADVARATGPVGVVPMSHRGYSTRKAAAAHTQTHARGDSKDADADDEAVCKDDDADGDGDGDGDGDEDQAAAIMATCPPPVWYSYRRGAPLLIDARTLHCAADNESEALRAVAWFIYNQDEAQGSEAEEEEAEEKEGDGAEGASGALAALRVADGGA
jgi:ectoine hydroxylase-related dioxygenase (phytanoyl-CoA dioxygenase family)